MCTAVAAAAAAKAATAVVVVAAAAATLLRFSADVSIIAKTEKSLIQHFIFLLT